MINNLSPDTKKPAELSFPFSGDKIPYGLDQNIRFRPEPGCDDMAPRKPLPRSDIIRDLRDLENRCRESQAYRKFVRKIKGLPVDERVKGAYLDYLTQTRISISDSVPEFDLDRELSTPVACSKVYNSLFASSSANLYHTLLHCMKFWCPECGGKDKKIHKRRERYMFRKMNRGRTPRNRAELRAAVARWLVRQLIFTVPGKDRWRFMSREGLNQLAGVARRAIKELFPGSRVEVYIHTVGDEDISKFNPHINVHIFLPRGSSFKLKISPAKLSAIKDRWARGLRRLGCSDVRGPGENIAGKLVDVQYKWASKPKEVMFKIEYMTRPLGPEHLTAWRQDPDGQKMIDLHVRQLKGFQFMRSWDRWAGCNYYDTEDAVKEVESVIGEPVEWIGYTSTSVVRDLIEAGKLEKVTDDLYIQRGPFTQARSP
ncbi:hypothetical protein ES708_18956 [subsurface metagenome]